MTPIEPSLHIQRWAGFTPSRAPCKGGHDASQWCPQQVERCHKGAATITTDRDVSEGLPPTQHHACHMFLTKPVARSSPPPEEAWHRPKHHHGATSMHQLAPNPTIKVAPDQHRRWEAPTASLKTCDPRTGHNQPYAATATGPPRPQPSLLRPHAPASPRRQCRRCRRSPPLPLPNASPRLGWHRIWWPLPLSPPTRRRWQDDL
jgi:hypothetical protein